MLGSILPGVLFARARGVDLRSIGSGNVGATNTSRALGKSTGWLVLVLDALKGFVPAAIARWLVEADPHLISAVAFSAVVGHCYPIWHRFAGGKGVATSIGGLLSAMPEIGAVSGLVFFVVRKLSRRASVASLSALTCALVIGLWWGNAAQQWLVAALWVLVLWRHRDNIERLLKGTEPRS